MELKIINEKENPLFNRKELEFEVQSNITPSKIDVGKSISEKFSTELDTIEIKRILGRFGSNFFKIIAFVYNTKDDRMSTERKPRLIAEKKADVQEEVKKEEESKEEKPKEEKTETKLKEDSKEKLTEDKSK